MPKIAIVGTFGVGKTTLFEALKKHPKLQDFIFFDEPARQWLEYKKLDINDVNADHERLYGLQITCVVHHHKLSKLDNFISDSSIYDNLAYAKHNLKPDVFEVVAKCANTVKCDYDYVFYLPIEFEMSSEDLAHNRVDDVEYQKAIDKEILEQLTLNVPINQIITVTGSVDERIEQILKIIKL